MTDAPIKNFYLFFLEVVKYNKMSPPSLHTILKVSCSSTTKEKLTNKVLVIFSLRNVKESYGECDM